jgi:TonB family protein
MTNMSLSSSPGPPEPGQKYPAWPSAPWDSAPPTDPAALFATLQQTLAAGAQSPDVIFLAITDAARVLTGASGTALALWTEGTIRCRARSGEIAPELGAALNVDSGISGECLRASKALRCDDTYTDDRVDPDVCHQLGVRSIAVVPVHRRGQTVGILEAFSRRPFAFSADQMNSLLHLAEIVETAHDREISARDPAPLEATRPVGWPEVLTAPAGVAEAAIVEKRSSSGRLRYWILGAGVVVLMLASTVAWLSWREPDAEVAASPQAAAAHTAPQEIAQHAPPAVVPYKPAAGRPREHADKSPTAGVLQNAAQLESTQIASPSGSTVDSINQTARPSSTTDPSPSEPPPAVTIEISERNDDIANVVSTTRALPAADLPISGGVTEAALIYKVQPVYPHAARTQRLEGTVVLEVTIGEDGTPQGLKVISGLPVLAQAAMSAVQQWRYQPSLLNGKPVAVQKQITIVFKTP